MGKKVLITGASGMLGFTIARAFFEDHYDVLGIGRKKIPSPFPYTQADLLNENQITDTLTTFSPDIIVHCAANVDLRDCEENRPYTYALHVNSTRKLASFRPEKTRFIYISTDSVFDGLTGNYNEKEKTSPLNYYASTKLEGETAATQSNAAAIIIRTNIYGFHTNPEMGNSLFEWLYKTLSQNASLRGFTDVCFNPLYVSQVFEVIKDCLAVEFKGIIHAGCKDFISKYTFAIRVAALFGFDISLVQPASSAIFQSVIQRPANTTLNVSYLESLTGKAYSLGSGLVALKEDFLQSAT